jgi:hypothetical protein
MATKRLILTYRLYVGEFGGARSRRRPLIVTGATLYWDRGRLARRSAVRLSDLARDLIPGATIAPVGARCGRDARGPSEELE